MICPCCNEAADNGAELVAAAVAAGYVLVVYGLAKAIGAYEYEFGVVGIAAKYWPGEIAYWTYSKHTHNYFLI